MKLGINQMTGRTIAFLFAAALLTACSGSGNATDGAGQSEDSSVAVAEASHPIRISQGEPVELSDYMVDGEYVVFDFMSDYCSPCKQLAPWMDRLHAERDGVSVVKIDINRPGVRGIDWKSPVAAQFRLSSIPHFKVMDGEGAVVAEGEQAWQMVVVWLQELDGTQESQGR